MPKETSDFASESHNNADSDAKAIKHIDDGSNRSLSSKENERLELQKQMEAFLSNGGQVSVIEQNVLADPPRRPVSNYGSRPI